MTPLEIHVALHYHCSPDPYDGPGGGSSAFADAVDGLVEAGLLRELPAPNAYGSRYEPTDGLAQYCHALCAVPRPVQKWVMP